MAVFTALFLKTPVKAFVLK